MFLIKLLAMIAAALLCPFFVSSISDGIADFADNVNAVTDENIGTTEKSGNEITAAQENWFKENKPTGVNPANVSDFTFTEYTYKDGIEIKGYGVKEYIGSSKEVVIPAEYNGKFVIAVDREAFKGKDITSVTLPKSTLCIGTSAFRECKYLENINLPENLQKIDGGAFADCKSLSSLNLGKNIKYLGDKAFHGCTLLKDVQITGGVSPLVIKEYCFGECTALEKVTISDYTEVLGQGAFSNCKALTYFTLIETEKEISIETHKYVFENCESLKSIDASHFKNIDNDVFHGCTALETVILPDNMESINGGAFMNCVSLKYITLPDSLTTLGTHAFSGCTSLTTINIPSSLTQFSEAVFKDSGITEIYIPSSISYVGRNAFENCTNLTKIEFADEGEKLTTDFCAFRNTGITELILPGRVTAVGNQSFISCANLKKVVYKSSGAAFADQNIEFKAFSETPLEEIHIPATVDKIDESALPRETTIYCPAGSNAESWAKQYEVNYVTE